MPTDTSSHPVIWKKAVQHDDLPIVETPREGSAPFDTPIDLGCFGENGYSRPRRAADLNELRLAIDNLHISRLSGEKNLHLVNEANSLFKGNRSMLFSFIASGVGMEDIISIANTMSRYHREHSPASCLGPGPLTPEEVVAYASAGKPVNTEILLTLKFYGIATPSRAAELSDSYNFTATTLDLLLHKSDNPEAAVELLLEGKVARALSLTVDEVIAAHSAGIYEVASILEHKKAGSPMEAWPFLHQLGYHPESRVGFLEGFSEDVTILLWRAGHTSYNALFEALPKFRRAVARCEPASKSNRLCPYTSTYAPWSPESYFSEMIDRFGAELTWKILKVHPGSPNTLRAARRSSRLADKLSSLDEESLRTVLILAEEAGEIDGKVPLVGDYLAYIALCGMSG